MTPEGIKAWGSWWRRPDSEWPPPAPPLPPGGLQGRLSTGREQGGAHFTPHKGLNISVRKERCRNAWAAPTATAPRLLWQIHRRRDPGVPSPAPRGLCTPPPPWPCGAGVWGGDSRLRESEQVTQGSNLPWHRVPGGLGAPPPAQASYFFPVRCMCWKRVMEKAMPRICIMRMHIPTVPSTCLLSSNHIFTFS